MLVLDYDAMVVNAKARGEEPLPTLEDVIYSAMADKDYPLKREEIIDIISRKTGINHDSLNSNISTRLRILEKRNKIRRSAKYGVWELVK